MANGIVEKVLSKQSILII